jgi:hypothetical protein
LWPLPSLVSTTGKYLLFPPALHFLNSVYIDSPRGFHLGTSGLYILCFWNYPLVLYHHAPLIFSSSLYSALYYIHIYLGCFNIFLFLTHSLTLSLSLPPPVAPSDRLTNNNKLKQNNKLNKIIILFSLSRCTYIHVYMYDHKCFCIYI